MTCNSSEALFEGYLDDTLLPAQRARLLGHLNSCGSCKGVLDELRVVDALLVSPREVELPPNFTFATMAEVRSLPRPCVPSSSVLAFAYLISYLVAAWLLIGAGFLLAGSTMRAFGETTLDASEHLMHPLVAIVQSGAHTLGDLGTFGAVLGGAIVLDVVVAAAMIFGVVVVRPRLAERLRS
ncbi:MAG: zf-HC2 domain-containing protein [Candidatus Eremiobacteraeota bacterium]|nr:zf-HC2 domain-containing protein [Candidatus Eremiobacteraeota bacterium]